MLDSKILEKVRKLLAMTKENGATEGEIENAVKMAQRLMLKHSIDEKDVIISSLDFDVTEIENSSKSFEPNFWMWHILTIIGECYQCKVLRQRIGKNCYYQIIGLETDRAITKEIFDTIIPVIRNLIDIRYKEYCKQKIDRYAGEYSVRELKYHNIIKSKKVYTTSYLKGFESGLNQRLQKDREEFFTDVNEKKDYALMVMKKDTLLTDFVTEQFSPKAVTQKRQTVMTEAFRLGQEDGAENNTKKQLH